MVVYCFGCCGVGFFCGGGICVVVLALCWVRWCLLVLCLCVRSVGVFVCVVGCVVWAVFLCVLLVGAVCWHGGGFFGSWLLCACVFFLVFCVWFLGCFFRGSGVRLFLCYELFVVWCGFVCFGGLLGCLVVLLGFGVVGVFCALRLLGGLLVCFLFGEGLEVCCLCLLFWVGFLCDFCG